MIFKIYLSSKCFYEGTENVLVDFDIRDHLELWISGLKTLVNHPCSLTFFTNNGYCKKLLYHIAYQYFMITENKVWLDCESKAIVQKIHDLEMPSDYFYELKEKILAL